MAEIFMLIKNIILFTALLVTTLRVNAQIRLTQSEAVTKAIQNSRNASAALLEIQQQQQLAKGAMNISNPELTWQSPTGSFYTGGVTQALDFPTVYARQYQLQKKQIGLAQAQKVLTDLEISYQIKNLYLNAQFADSLKNQLYIQDTIYQQLAVAAKRLFAAGQIDYLQQTFAETQYGEIHNQYEQARLSAAALLNQLRFITGLKEAIALSPLVPYASAISPGLISIDTTLISQNAELLVSKQNEEISRINIGLQRSKALPGLVFGYQNQAERSTPLNMRLQFGVTVPLWFWQNKSNISAARTELAITQERSAGLQQQLTIQLSQAQNELAVNQQALRYYQQTGLQKSNEILTVARRFLDSGEIDYITYLRNINDAYQIKQRYLEALRNVNQNRNTLDYLSGKI